MRADIDLDCLRADLIQRRDALAAGSAGRAEAAATVELDQQRTGRLTRMDALQSQAMAEATRQRAERELLRIDSALRRLEAGDYGDCLRCGDPIAPGRLQVDPAATLCIDCAEQSGGRR